MEKPLPNFADWTPRQVVVATLVLGIAVVRGGLNNPQQTALEPTPRLSETRPASGGTSTAPSVAPSPSATSASPTPVVPPQSGSGDFVTAPGESPVLGFAGELLRYRVQVELLDSAPVFDPEEFAAMVDATLGDPRSWIAGGTVRFQRTATEPWDFTVYLATPDTVDVLCAGVNTNGYTSCRNGDRVVINLARWLLAVEHWDSDLTTYRQYVINHEVGHRLGERHQRCPGPGQPAPVMQQQTLTLAECHGNAWPYINGEEYSGELGSY